VYNYWSSPVQNTSINDAFGSTGRKFYTFDSLNQAWEGASTTDVLDAGRGFIATGTSNTPTTIIRSFSDNSGFNSGDISQSLYNSGSFHADSNWHLVGNPYPSGLNVDAFITDNATEIESSVYLWSSDGSDYNSLESDYAIMGLAGAVSAGGSGVNPTSATISSAQGFFVQSLTSTSGNLTFSNSQRVSTNNTFQRIKPDMERIWLGVEKENGAKNELLLAFLDEAEEGKDLYDDSKLSGNSFVSLYSIGDFKSGEQELAIQGLPSFINERTIPIGIEVKEAGEFTFSINYLDGFDSETQLFLYDTEIESLIDLRAGNYTVSLEKGEFNERFSLRFIGGKITDLPEDSLGELNDLGINLYATKNEIRIQFTHSELAKSQIEIYDISGRLLFVQSNKNQALDIKIPVVQSGIYIVKVASQNGIVSRKLFVE
jgi:hypothetical protein